jgi:hypothetical protein
MKKSEPRDDLCSSGKLSSTRRLRSWTAIGQRKQKDERLHAVECAVREEASSEAQHQQIEDLKQQLADAKNELERQADLVAKV